ncbi:MAG: two-component sensor histidine kinase, partial [Desulfobacteraceae bacterium]|nr:two-component sensor histidine kinase [Desulfobacteraceae bacterium]
MRETGFSDRQDSLISLKWIILSRAVFAIVLSISCFIFSTSENLSLTSQPFLSLYNISGCFFLLTIFYVVLIKRVVNLSVFAYFQLVFDSFCITAIIFVTGGFESIATFLYLVVIIYASLLIQLRGSLVIATISSIQYAILIELEYYRMITPTMGYFYFSGNYDEWNIVYRIITVCFACFAVAVLSGILALQAKRAKQDLKIAQEHLKRVEKMAAMDEMLAGIAHEIKNPLASLSGSIQLLNEETPPGTYADKLMNIVLRETDRLKDIVNDLRLFARPKKAGASEIRIDKAINEIVEMFTHDPKWHDRIKIILNSDRKVFIYIDPAHFRQILWNLLKNAAESIE